MCSKSGGGGAGVELSTSIGEASTDGAIATPESEASTSRRTFLLGPLRSAETTGVDGPSLSGRSSSSNDVCRPNSRSRSNDVPREVGGEENSRSCGDGRGTG